MKHKPGCCHDDDDRSTNCTCGALVMAKAYRFANGNYIAFDQNGHQMAYYQGQDAPELTARDFPHIVIGAGEMAR